MRYFFASALLIIPCLIKAQSPIADFSLPTNTCLNQSIELQNLSGGAIQYNWDFCQGDLALPPTASIAKNMGGKTTGIEVVFDGTNWFGFVASENANSILRLEFGSDLTSTPTVTDLGNISGKINKPADIKVVFDNGNWYGFVYGMDAPMIARIDFGNSLLNTTSSPSPVTATQVVGGSGSTNGGFDLTYDGSKWIIVYAQSSTLSIAKLQTITSVPQPADIRTGITIPAASSIGDIKLQKYNGSFYGYVIAYGSQTLHRLSFGTDIFTPTPGITNISSFLTAGPRAYGLDLGVDNGNYYLFLATLEGNLLKINLGKDLSLAPVSGSNLGTFSTLTNNVKLKLAKHNSRWHLFSPNFSSGQLYRVSFPAPSDCAASLTTSIESEPVVHFTSPGTSYITLRGSDGGSFNEIHKSIEVDNAQAPDVDFTFQNICRNIPANFSAVNTSGSIITYDWQFDDGNTYSGTTTEAANTYAATGEFNVSLTLTNTDGCNNSVEKLVKIYAPPVANFTSPSSLICTNGEILFTNNTDDNFDGHLTYEWYVDGDQVSTTRDLRHTFSTTGAKTIKLKTSIPGCFDEKDYVTSDVEAGPAVDFSFSGICEGTATQFNSIVGETNASRDWDFGGGNSSSQPDPSHLFAAAGTYSVSLTALSSSGCNNTKTKTITIRSRPAVNFFVDPPPNSCSNTQTDFINLTTDPVDSDIVSWQWNFDDPASPAPSDARDPAHTFINAGTYNVALTATTDFGCFRTLQKPIAIAQSPVASIDHSKVCNNLPVNFTSTGTNIFTHYWEMGTSYYEVANPVHTFSTPGDHTVKLVVKGNNLCEATYNKIVSVPEPLVPDFSVTKNCEGIDAIFTDATTGADAVSQQTWDFGGLGSATGSPASFRFNATGNRNIRLSVTGQSGCSYGATKTISVATAPAAGFTANPETGAAPLSVHFTNTSTNANRYDWSFGDGVGTSAQASPDYLFQQTGDFVTTLTATNNEGCESSISKVIRVVAPLPDVGLRIITVSENPDGTLKVIITLQNIGNTILKDLPVYVDISGNVTLREMVQGPIAPSAQHNLVLSYGLAPGNVGFLCATADLLNDFAPQDNRICTELNEKTSFISPYPNPVKDILHVEWISPARTPVDISLVDTFGKKMLNSSVLSAEGLNQYRLDVSGLQSGIYFLLIQDGKALKTEKILISAEN